MIKEEINSNDVRDFLKDPRAIELRDKLIHKLELSFGSNSTNIRKKFIDCEFTGGGVFENIHITKDLVFENCIFSGDADEEFFFINITSGGFVLRHDNVFNCLVTFKDLLNRSTEIGGSYNQEIKISGGNCDLAIRGSGNNLSTYSDISISNSSRFKKILFRDLKQVGQITFYKEVSEDLNFAQGEFDTIQFQNTFDLKKLKFGSLQNNSKFSVKTISLPNLNLTGGIGFINALISNLNMANLNCEMGEIIFRSVKFIGDVQIEDSELENVKFIDTDFHNAKLYFDRSVFDKVIFSNITWTPNHSVESKLPNKTKEEKTRRFMILTEVYRQLKKNSLAEADQIRALKFYRNEMDAYWNRIKLDKTESNWNRFLIRVNKVSSNFGQSYMQPLLLLIGFHLLFYSCIMNWYFWNQFSAEFEFGQFWYLLNPVHKTPDYINTGWGHFTEFAMRVVNGYFIYHFIKATRKFGKV